jgi:hypothetical protein
MMSSKATKKDALPPGPTEVDPTVSAIGNSVLRVVLTVVLVVCVVAAIIGYINLNAVK